MSDVNDFEDDEVVKHSISNIIGRIILGIIILGLSVTVVVLAFKNIIDGPWAVPCVITAVFGLYLIGIPIIQYTNEY